MRLLKAVLLLALFSTNLQAGGWIKQATATTVNLGPFVKIADGSLEEAPTVANVDVVIIKHSDTSAATHVHIVPAASGSNNDMVLVDNAMFNLELTTTDTNTAGRFDVTAIYTGCYPVFDSFMVVGEDRYDSLTDVATVQDVWAELTSGIAATGSIGKQLVDNVDTATSSRLAPDSVVAEPTGALSATPTVAEILAWLKVTAHNKMTVTRTLKTLHNAADTAIATQTLSDDGTTATATKAQ